jgi:hypothetical protein
MRPWIRPSTERLDSLDPGVKYTKLRHNRRHPKTNKESANQSNVFQDADCCYHVQSYTISVTSASSSPFNSLSSSFSQHSLRLMSTEMRCRILSYKHTNVSQENSASTFRVDEYSTMDDKKAPHSTKTFLSTKLHGVIRRSTIISVLFIKLFCYDPLQYYYFC